MSSLISCFKTLKMKYQISIGNIFIMGIIIAVIMCTYFIQQTILFNFIQSSSELISMREEKRQLNVALHLIENYLERKYHKAILNIHHIDDFFQYSLENENRYYNISNELFQPCVKPENIKSQNIMLNSNLFCYQQLRIDDAKQFQKIVSLLSQFSLLFDVTSETQLTISNLPNPSLIISYPMMIQMTDFNINARPWYFLLLYRYISYLEMSEQNPDESYYYSPIYQSAFSNTYVRAAISTIKFNNSNYGINKNTIQLSDQQLTAVPINILLVNINGQIIFSNVDSIQANYYIYDEQITGFNTTDWEYIQQYVKSLQSDQLCNKQLNTFCLFNKYYQAFVQIDASQFKKEQFNLILFTNVTFQTELDIRMANLTDSLIFEFVKIEWILILACCAMLIVTVVLIHLIFIPLSQLMDNVKLHIHRMGNNINKEIFKLINLRKQPSNVFSELHVRFLALYEMLNKNQNQKNKLCLEIEALNYNLKPTDLDYCQISKKVQQFPLNVLHSPNSIEFVNNTLKQQFCQNHQNK